MRLDVLWWSGRVSGRCSLAGDLAVGVGVGVGVGAGSRVPSFTNWAGRLRSVLGIMRILVWKIVYFTSLL